MFCLQNFNLTVTKIILIHSNDWRINEKQVVRGQRGAFHELRMNSIQTGPGTDSAVYELEMLHVLTQALHANSKGYEQEYNATVTWLITKTSQSMTTNVGAPHGMLEWRMSIHEP